VPELEQRRASDGGGGSGTREGEQGSGGGGGGGGFVTPVGFIVVRDGGAEFERITTPADWIAVVAATSIALVTLKRLLA
jgi:uncharacterized spore protein YtfJ